MDTETIDLIISKIDELLSEIDQHKHAGVSFVDTGAFKNWQAAVEKWLRLGGIYTADELSRFHRLRFWIPRMRLPYEPRFITEDSEIYNRDLDQTSGILSSAIENLTLQLSPETKVEEEGRARSVHNSGSNLNNISIHQAENVVLGDRNTITVDKRATVETFFRALETKIQTEVPEPDRTSLRKTLTDLLRHPAFLAILSQGLPEVLKRI